MVNLTSSPLLDLLDSLETGVRRTDPATSKNSAKLVNTKKVSMLILQVLTECPSTAPEIAKVLGVPRDSISPRLKPLERKGLIKRHGVALNRSTGCDNIVWAVTRDFGLPKFIEHKHTCRECGRAYE